MSLQRGTTVKAASTLREEVGRKNIRKLQIDSGEANVLDSYRGIGSINSALSNRLIRQPSTAKAGSAKFPKSPFTSRFPNSPIGESALATPTFGAVSTRGKEMERELIKLLAAQKLNDRKELSQVKTQFRNVWSPDNHHCPNCQKPLDSEKGLNRCYGNHVIACENYHTRLVAMFNSVVDAKSASKACVTCLSEDEMWKKQEKYYETARTLLADLQKKDAAPKDIKALEAHVESIHKFIGDTIVRKAVARELRRVGCEGWIKSNQPTYKATLAKDDPDVEVVLAGGVMDGKPAAPEPDWALTDKLAAAYKETSKVKVKKSGKEAYKASRHGDVNGARSPKRAK
ncbi:hypothetical protein DFH27DRAFT_614287 [Peziza echinospora]|nr:hypothetical protein DFH27DRAFT_614287 [Peziza echinospora]